MIPDRVLDKIEPVPECGCWLWTGCVDSSGYGSMRGDDGARVRPHRYIYERMVGPIPEGMVLMHKCDTRRCCNPDHLQPGHHRENMADMVEKGRSPRCFGEANHQHRYSEAVRVVVKSLCRLHSVTTVSVMTGISRGSVHRFRHS